MSGRAGRRLLIGAAGTVFLLFRFALGKGRGERKRPEHASGRDVPGSPEERLRQWLRGIEALRRRRTPPARP